MNSGFINVNKPAGLSSAAAVSKVKRVCGLSCGHMGTLDPLACGVLPVAVGNASRLFSYLLNKKKVYRAVFVFGKTTDTLDAEGTLTQEGGRIPTASQIQSVLPSFIGEVEQMPPAFSAKSVGGVRAYKLARQGKEVILTPKKVFIENIALCGENGNSFEFEISCGGGTYIRSLARDISAACGTYAYMSSLVRERSGDFLLENAVSPIELTRENWREFLIPTDGVIAFPSLRFDGVRAVRLKNGLTQPCNEANGEYKLYLEGDFYGIAEVENGLVRAKVKLV